MSGLNGRVRVLERRQHRAAGCADCHGQAVVPVAPGDGLPSWMDDAARCRGCGQMVKLCDRDAWDAL